MSGGQRISQSNRPMHVLLRRALAVSSVIVDVRAILQAPFLLYSPIFIQLDISLVSPKTFLHAVHVAGSLANTRNHFKCI